MKIQTYTVCVGSKACNANCPYCVSKMTPSQGIDLSISETNWRNFEIGCGFAKNSGVSTVLFTGKGEPTLFPCQITEFLEHLQAYNFSFIELQTNGMLFLQKKEKYAEHLKKWYDLGLTTIALSIVHYENRKNQETYQPKGPYIDLVELISYLHSIGFSVRLSCMMFKGGIDSAKEVKNLINFARKNKVEQLSVRSIEMPEKSESREVAQWVREHKLNKRQLREIGKFLRKNGTELMRLVHGAIVYDVDGQNICFTNCLTIDPSSEEVRQLIFFPDGHLRYDWQYPGAILL